MNIVLLLANRTAHTARTCLLRAYVISVAATYSVLIRPMLTTLCDKLDM
jgi:hypothetical protein